MNTQIIVSSLKIIFLSGIFLPFLLFAQTVGASGTCAVPPSGIVGWWPADQNANDIVGHNNGTFNGTYVPGEVSYAFNISGSGADFAIVPQNSAFEPQNVTVDAWVKANGSPGNFKYVVAKGSSGCTGGASYALYTGQDGGLKFYVSDGSNFFLSPDFGQGVWDNQWHFVAGTYDGSFVKLYVDGNLVGSTATTAAINYHLIDNDLVFGNYPACTDNLSFKGSIDEVEIFSRALSQSEIQSIFNAGSLGKCNIAIDIKPGSSPNCLNINDHGVIPVAILGGPNLNVNNIDQSTLSFNGLAVNVKSHQTLQCSVQNINNDIYPDLVCQFVNSTLDWGGGNSTAILTGNLFNHTHIVGSDSICIVPN